MNILLSVALLPLKLIAFFVRLVLAVTRTVLGGVILGCLAPLGLVTLLLVVAVAILVF